MSKFGDDPAPAGDAVDPVMAPPSPASDGSPMAPGESIGLAERDRAAEQAPPRLMLAAFVNAVERLERILELETQMLNENKPIVLHDFNHKKSHGLLELSRAMTACRALDRPAFDLEARAPLARLRGKLESNLASLQTHLSAVGEIAAIIARAIEDHESDGTYSARKYPLADRG